MVHDGYQLLLRRPHEFLMMGMLIIRSAFHWVAGRQMLADNGALRRLCAHPSHPENHPELFSLESHEFSFLGILPHWQPEYVHSHCQDFSEVIQIVLQEIYPQQ